MRGIQLLLLVVSLHAVVISECWSWPYREIAVKMNDADTNIDSKWDGKITFPTSEPLLEQRITLVNKPNCSHSTFCEEDPHYPGNIIERALRMNTDLKLVSTIDSVPNDISNRMNAPSEDNSLCESYEKVVFPKTAESKNKEWLFIVNQENFRQGVRVEICSHENRVCDMFDGFYEGYKTICKQKYIYRQLVAVSQSGEMAPETFRFPSSCCCHVKFLGDYSLRIGLGRNKTKMQSKRRKK